MKSNLQKGGSQVNSDYVSKDIFKTAVYWNKAQVKN
jgi:hypothetical protein